MPDHVSDQQLGDAVLESVQHDSFPQSEHVASAQLSPATLPKLLDIVGKAREEKKVRRKEKRFHLFVSVKYSSRGTCLLIFIPPKHRAKYAKSREMHPPT